MKKYSYQFYELIEGLTCRKAEKNLDYFPKFLFRFFITSNRCFAFYNMNKNRSTCNFIPTFTTIKFQTKNKLSGR